MCTMNWNAVASGVLTAVLVWGVAGAGGEPAAAPAVASASAADPTAWGRTHEGLAAGLHCESVEFVTDRPLRLTVRVANLGGERLRLRAALSPAAWRIVLRPERGGPELVASAVPRPGDAESDLLLPPGAGREIPLEVAATAWAAAMRPGQPAAAPAEPAPGGYALVAEFTAATAGAGFWQGTVTTGQLRVEAVRSDAQIARRIDALSAAAASAEKAYAAGRTRPLYEAYVMASQARLQAMVAFAEETRPNSERRRRLAAQAAGEIRAWLRHQDDARYDAPPQGVSMWMHLHLGLGLRLAGEPENACLDGFDKTLTYSPGDFPDEVQPWAWRIWLTAKLQKAQVLAGKREWRLARDELDPAFGFRPESRGLPLGIRARLLGAACLGGLGEYRRGAEEFRTALAEIDKLRIRGGELGRQAADLRRRAVCEMGEMVAAAAAAGWEIRGRN